MVFTSSALNEIERLPTIEIARIIRKIDALSLNPKPHGVKKNKR